MHTECTQHVPCTTAKAPRTRAIHVWSHLSCPPTLQVALHVVGRKVGALLDQPLELLRTGIRFSFASIRTGRMEVAAVAFDPAQKRATTQSLRGGFGAPQSFEWGQAATPVLGTACAHPCSRRQTLSSIRRARARRSALARAIGRSRAREALLQPRAPRASLRWVPGPMGLITARG